MNLRQPKDLSFHTAGTLYHIYQPTNQQINHPANIRPPTKCPLKPSSTQLCIREKCLSRDVLCALSPPRWYGKLFFNLYGSLRKRYHAWTWTWEGWRLIGGFQLCYAMLCVITQWKGKGGEAGLNERRADIVVVGGEEVSITIYPPTYV